MAPERVAVVLGSELKVGDTIKVWWKPNRDVIVSLVPYRGRYERQPDWQGVRSATFGVLKIGMTIFPGETFEKIEAAPQD